MSRTILALLLVMFFPSLLGAQSGQDSRRIEEEKRESLRATEMRARREEPSLESRAETPEFNYLQELFLKKVARVSDATRVLVILLGAQAEVGDFAAQRAFLKQKNVISERVSLSDSADMPLEKGLASYMFCQALGIKGGLWLRLFGVNQRYALRELAYEGIITPGSTQEIVSGKELVSIFIGSVEYLVRQAPPT